MLTNLTFHGKMYLPSRFATSQRYASPRLMLRCRNSDAVGIRTNLRPRQRAIIGESNSHVSHVLAKYILLERWTTSEDPLEVRYRFWKLACSEYSPRIAVVPRKHLCPSGGSESQKSLPKNLMHPSANRTTLMVLLPKKIRYVTYSNCRYETYTKDVFQSVATFLACLPVLFSFSHSPSFFVHLF